MAVGEATSLDWHRERHRATHYKRAIFEEARSDTAAASRRNASHGSGTFAFTVAY